MALIASVPAARFGTGATAIKGKPTSFGRHSATGFGVATGTDPYPDERLRVIFDAYGRVSSIEQMTRR